MTKKLTILLLAAALPLALGCTKVSPGWAGIEVYNYGDQKGVEDFPVQVGRIWFNPVTTDVYKFPTFAQTVNWTKSTDEGSPNDDSITFSDAKGVMFNADVALTYTIQRDQVPHLFVKFRQGVEHLTNVYMRNKVREAFNNVGSEYEAMAIVGEGKAQFQADVKEELNRILGEDGIVFDTVAMLGAPRVDQKVQASINAALDATQRAIKARNEVAEREAEAAKKIADARGEAESVRIQAEAEAEANRIVAASISPDLVRYRAVDRWDGSMPLVTGGALPFIDLGSVLTGKASAIRAASSAGAGGKFAHLPEGSPLRKALEEKSKAP